MRARGVVGRARLDPDLGHYQLIRAAVYELLTLDEAIRNIIHHGSSSDEIRSLALQRGMTPMPQHGVALARLGRVESLSFGEAPAGGAAQIVVDEATFILPLEGVIDIAAEKTRLAKALAAAEKERDGLGNRLNNPAFVEKAKPEAVAKAREDHAEKSAEAQRLKAALDRLG